MDKQVALREVVAELLKIPTGEVGPGLSLNGQRLHGSIGRAKLDAAIQRKLGMTSAAVYSAASLGELEGALFGTGGNGGANGNGASGGVAAADAPSAAGSAPSPLAGTIYEMSGLGLACGVDVELVENLPEAGDVWEHEFYRRNFTAGETAYCLMQETPRPHFAARWCAKEALKKCDARFLREPNDQIELVSDGAGAPALRHLKGGTPTPLPHAVSVSHTRDFAMAVVIVRAADGEGISNPTAAAPAVAAASVGRGAARARRSWITMLVSLVALALAAWALARTFHG